MSELPASFDLYKTVIAKSSTLTFRKSFYQGGLINRHVQAFGLVARTVDFGLYSSEFADPGSRTITEGRPLHARLPWLGSLPGQAPPIQLISTHQRDRNLAVPSPSPGTRGFPCLLASQPLYYMGNQDQNQLNRKRTCPDGWAAANGDASAMDDATDKPNCDEFAFASSYNSGGMAKSEGGLNEAVPTGSATGEPDGKGTPSGTIEIYLKGAPEMVLHAALSLFQPQLEQVTWRVRTA